MRQHVKEFLNSIENETSLRFNLNIPNPNSKYIGGNNQPLESDTVGIDNGCLLLVIVSCGHKQCKEILGIDIFHGLGGNGSTEAEDVKTQINKLVPKVPIKLYNLLRPSSMFAEENHEN